MGPVAQPIALALLAISLAVGLILIWLKPRYQRMQDGMAKTLCGLALAIIGAFAIIAGTCGVLSLPFGG